MPEQEVVEVLQMLGEEARRACDWDVLQWIEEVIYETEDVDIEGLMV